MYFSFFIIFFSFFVIDDLIIEKQNMIDYILTQFSNEKKWSQYCKAASEKYHSFKKILRNFKIFNL